MKTVQFGDRLFETGCIIFDKDGTLTDFKKTWVPILEKRSELILRNIHTGFHPTRIKSAFYDAFGVYNNYINPYGPFPYSTPWEDEIIFAMVLYRFGVPWQKGKDAAREAIDRAEKEIDRTQYAELYRGVKEVLVQLRKNGILIALATADLADIATDTLKHVGIADLFDYVVGADMVENDKPYPDMIEKVVEVLKVDKQHTVMVGDSITDMAMGRRAHTGLVVGVLEGEVASQEDLTKDANVVIESVREIRVVGANS